MLASGSTHFFRPPPSEWSPSEDDSDTDADDDEDEVTDITSPILICPECLHSFPYSQRSTSPSTLSQIRAKYVPTPDESARIQLLIENVETDLTRYSEEIRYLERTVRKLTRQRDQLQQYQREQITLISPIRRLPAELLTRIFEYHCITPIFIRHDAIIAPILSLSQVCAFWQGVALSLPHLWSFLDIDLGGRGVFKYGLIQLIQLILTNSESSPLTFYLHFGHQVEANHLLIHALLEHAHRWGTVFFESSGSEPFLSLVSDPSNHGIGLPLLKSLTLRHIENLTRFDIFQYARALEHLTVDDVVFDFSVPFGTTAATLLPCGQLKSATFSRQIMQQVMSVLSSSPNLQNVTIRNAFIPRDNAGLSNMQHVQLNYLTSLTISTHHFEQLFIHMSAPALTSLTIAPPWDVFHQDMHRFLFPQTAFLAFLRRGRGMGLGSSNEHTLLENLKFDGVKGLTDLHLLAILELTPKLKTLMIREYAETWSLSTPLTPPGVSPGNYTITNYLIRALTIPRHIGEDLSEWNSSLTSSSSLEASSSMSVTLRHPFSALASANILVPQLHTIDFVAKPSSIDYGLLTDMIASRSRSHSQPHPAWQQRRHWQVISPLRNISVRQGRIPYPVYNEFPSSHFSRPIVTLEPVFLSTDPDRDDGGPEYHRSHGGQDTGFGVCVDGDSSHGLGTSNAHRLAGPDPVLLNEQEIAHYRATTNATTGPIQAEAQGESDAGDWTSGMVQKMKEKAVKCFWWGGSMTTPGFSFFRLVSSVL